ncbi:MAG: hypothetical protein ACREEB_12310 [Caulobacteraceae bacterium]
MLKDARGLGVALIWLVAAAGGIGGARAEVPTGAMASAASATVFAGSSPTAGSQPPVQTVAERSASPVVLPPTSGYVAPPTISQTSQAGPADSHPPTRPRWSAGRPAKGAFDPERRDARGRSRPGPGGFLTAASVDPVGSGEAYIGSYLVGVFTAIAVAFPLALMAVRSARRAPARQVGPGQPAMRQRRPPVEPAPAEAPPAAAERGQNRREASDLAPRPKKKRITSSMRAAGASALESSAGAESLEEAAAAIYLAMEDRRIRDLFH